jgi:hypothetical protein
LERRSVGPRNIRAMQTFETLGALFAVLGPEVVARRRRGRWDGRARR